MARVLRDGRDPQGRFLLESDEARRDWELRGPFCEGWPVYHAIHDAESRRDLRRRRERVARRGVWRSPDLGETWEHSSEGLDLRRGRRAEAVEGLRPRRRARPRARRRRGGRRLREPRRRRHLVAAHDARRPAGPRGLERRRRTSRPATSACRACCRTRTTPTASGSIVQGFGAFETTDGGASWTPRNRGLRADWPREHEEVGFCVHKLVMSPADHERLYQQNHCGMHRSDDAGRSWTEITEGLPSDFGFAAAAHPHDRDTFYVIPLDAGHGRVDAGRAARRSGARATRARRWERLDARPAAARRVPRRAARGDGDRRARRRRASTSARAPASCSRAPTRATRGARSRATCRAICVGRGRGAVELSRMADVHLPADAAAAVRGPAAPARRSTRRRVAEAIDAPRRALARPARPALRAAGPALRPHIHVFVDGERAELDTPLAARVARRRDRRDQRRLTLRPV